MARPDRIAYLDASALVKLVVAEPERPALVRHVREALLTTSELAIVELTLACRRAIQTPEAERRARELLRDISLVAADRAVLERAASAAPTSLRALDAIHLATALAIEPDEFVAYDRRLLDAAREAGLMVASPT